MKGTLKDKTLDRNELKLYTVHIIQFHFPIVKMRFSIVTIFTLGTLASAYELPANLKQIYNQHKVYFIPRQIFVTLLTRMIEQAGTCSKKLSSSFSGGASYCGDIPSAIFLKGSDGKYDNMDIDCDGANKSGGKCSNDPSGQGQTAFKDTVKTYGISDLDANIHPYVVFGNEGSSPSFNPQAKGMKPLSVVAVVCNSQVVCIVLHFIKSTKFCFHTSSTLDELIADHFYSSMVFGETLMVVPLLERHPWLSATFAFLKRICLVIQDMILRMFFISVLLAVVPFLARVRTGRPKRL